MLSTLKARSSAAGVAKSCIVGAGKRGQALVGLPSAGFSTTLVLGESRLFAVRALRTTLADLQSAGRARSFCSGSTGKKPPKGFEKFHQRAKPKSQASESSKGPSEGAKAEESAKAKETAKETPSGGPKETPEKDSSKSSKKSTGSSKSEGPKIPGLGEVNRQTLGIAAGVAAFLLYNSFQGTEPEEEITIQELMREHLAKGHVERIQIVNKSVGRVLLRHDAPAKYAGRELSIQLGTPEAFEAKIEQLQADMGIKPLEYVPIQYVSETSIASELMPMLPTLLILIPLLFAARGIASGMGQMGGGAGGGPGGRNIFSIGKAFPSGQKDVKSKVKFDDVAGLSQAKKEVVEFVDFLKAPEKYEALGARTPKGGLLVGPPGTGKTLLAKAGEAGCPFFSMSGSDFIEMFVGVGPSRVRDLFQQARSQAPSIIFIDEIDAIGRKRGRGGAGGGNDERENTLNQLLVEMDGFSSSTGVVVLAGTNRADILDDALKRPGRFDRQIAIDKPDLNERQQIFMVHLKPIMITETLDKESIAKRMSALTPGFAGADIANICNEAAIFAARRSAKGVEMVDFERATERVMGGLVKENSLMGEKERNVVAIHESGHALAGWFLQYADPLLKVSIVPRSSGALGFAQYLPDEIMLLPQEAIQDKIAVALAGRAAEELFVGKISTGASDDLDKVTKMAYAMVSVYGMNPNIGLVSYNQNNASEQFYKPYSEATAQLIDAEAKLIIDIQYARVKKLLTEKGDLLKAMSAELMKEETLVYNQLVKILGERPFGIKEQFKQFVTASGNPFDMSAEMKKEPTEKTEEESSADSKVPPTPVDAGSSAPSQTTTSASP